MDPDHISALDVDVTTDEPFVVEPWPDTFGEPRDDEHEAALLVEQDGFDRLDNEAEQARQAWQANARADAVAREAGPVTGEIIDTLPATPELKGELQVFDPILGALARVSDAGALLHSYGVTCLDEADDTLLARVDQDAAVVLKIGAEMRGMIAGQFVTRLDKRGKWTRHVLTDEGPCFKVTSPGPTAGTIGYDTDLLVDAVTDGIKRGVIDQEAADSAVEPIRTTPPVTYDLLRRARAGLANELTAAEEELVLINLDRVIDQEPPTRYRQRPAGIAALLKNPGMKAEIKACEIALTPPPRMAKITTVPRKGA